MLFFLICSHFFLKHFSAGTFTDVVSFSSQVKVYDMEENQHGPDDVLVMGTDGLWDVTTDREVADAVSSYLSGCDPSDPMRCVSFNPRHQACVGARGVHLMGTCVLVAT